jgi:hypothetical protein
LQNLIFIGTFSLGTKAFRRHKDASAALSSAKTRGQRSALIEVLAAAEQRAEANLKKVTT